MVRILVALLLSLALCPVLAQRVDFGETAVQITPIAVIEDPDQMAALAKAAAVLQAYTAEHQVEACGELTSNADNAFRIRLGTIGSHIACVSDPTASDGYEPLSHALTIHSHPPRSTYLANAADVAIQNQVDNRAHGGTKVGVRLGQALHVDTAGFSAQDFQQPGWLVVQGRLWFQSGPQSVHDLGPILAPSAPTPVAP